ncbi:MAG: glycosyltransferase [Candidatus Aenigmatarchaeota archaeon]
MKVGFVVGSGSLKLEMQTYKYINRYGIKPIAITTNDIKYKIDKCFEDRKINSIKITQSTEYLLNLKKVTEDLDIIHTVESWYNITKQCLSLNKPLVVTVWENVPLGGEKTKYSIINDYRWKIKQKVFKNATCLIAVSKSAKNALEIDGADPDKIVVIPFGIDTKQFNIIKNDKKEKDKITISFVGRLVYEKGILDLLYVFSKLAKKHPNITLQIAGTGPLKWDIERIVERLGIKERVKLLGTVPHEKISTVYSTTDIFCVPSIPTKLWQEQLGYVFLEAMASGVPVVSTLSGAIPEVVENGKTGILVPPGDLKSLENAIEELIQSEKKREEFGKAGRVRVEEKNNSVQIAKRLADLYKRIKS